jgi:hypothetical protein
MPHAGRCIKRLELDQKIATDACTIDLADFNGTAHRDVKLFVLHSKVTQFQRAHDDCVGGCLIRRRQGPSRFEEVDVQP